MPTPEEIKNLAELYADKECEQSSLEDKEILQLHEDKIIEFYDVWGFLLENFCIVPKSKVRELRQLVADNADSIDHGLIDGLSDWVEFNLSTELFNEEK